MSSKKRKCSSKSSKKRKSDSGNGKKTGAARQNQALSSIMAPSAATAVTPTRQLAPLTTPEEGVTITEYLHAYTEADGTKVMKRIILKRIAPGSAAFAALGLATADTSSSADSDIDPSSQDDFKRACLARHNELRALHNCPPLVISTEMCHFAQEWADHLAHYDSHVHSKGRSYGENIFWKMTPSLTVAGHEPVDSWYKEIDLYDRAWYGLPSPPPGSFKASGHYTQLVWRATTRMGVGLALNGITFYVVANYDPHGNIVGRYRENVLPPLSWKMKLPPLVSSVDKEGSNG